MGLAARYREVRRQTEELARPLSAEDCEVQSMPDASPAKWHLAHTTWFFETFVLAGARAPSSTRVRLPLQLVLQGGRRPRHPRAARGLLSRPSLDEVRAYRRHVDERRAASRLRARRCGDDARAARSVLGCTTSSSTRS